MGMFDNITVELALPELPPALFQRAEAKDLVFQTKDTPNQGLSMYKIDKKGQLWLEKFEGHWQEGTPAVEGAGFAERIASLGRFVSDKEWWEKENYTGTIYFYESYNHPEYNTDNVETNDRWMRFDSGWVEYCAKLKNGKLIEPIEQFDHKAPKKYSDEELEKRKLDAAVNRAERERELRENRIKTPSPSQQLIDYIYNVCNKTIMDENDMIETLGIIKQKILEYRITHDIWYVES